MSGKFFWGAASSSHQVEGGNFNDWSEFEKSRSLVESGRACDHYNRFQDDFDIVKSLGHNAHRFSIEWSRVEPEEGKYSEKEIEHYRAVISALRERGIEPYVTLWHWTIPLWFRNKGGWECSDAPKLFARFAERMAREFPEVQYWITLNEPNVYTGNGYWRGKWPPGKKHSLFGYVRANHHLSQGHIAAYKAIKKIHPQTEVGITNNMIYFSRLKNAGKNFIYNHLFLRSIKKYQDFVGVNYYFSDRLRDQKSDMKWGIDPEGLYFVLKEAGRYARPVYIFENGIANSPDDKRALFIKDHVDWMKKAIRDGVDVRGYFYWSLMDNFEWADGFWPRFGLVEVNYNTLERTIRPSAWEYKKIIEKGLQ